jgi:cytochrome c peroxidase
MHNGAFGSLAQVIAFYNRGGGQGAGAALPNQTLSADALHLTLADQHALVAFLGALTDTIAAAGNK